MRLLFVVPHPLFPPNRGNKHHTLNLLRQICQHHDVDVLAFDEGAPSDDPGWQALRLELPRLNVIGRFPKLTGLRLLLGQVRSFVCLQPLVLARYRNRALFGVLRSTAGSYDAVCFDMFVTSEGILHCGAVPTLLLATDAYSLAAKGVRSLVTGFRRRFRLWLEEHLMARHEARFYPRFGRVLMVSRVDIDRLEPRTPGSKYEFLPVPVEQAVLNAEAVSHDRRRPPKLVIWAPVSQDGVAVGVRRFLEDAWPKIRERIPGATCEVWGASPHQLLAGALRAPGVGSVAFVEDWVSHLKTAAVFVFPQETGAGLYTKLQSAMGLGLPCVVTPAVIGGLPVAQGDTIFVERDPAGFARACIDLLADADLRARVGAAARRAVLEAHDPVRLAEKFLNTIEHVVAEHEQNSSWRPREQSEPGETKSRYPR